MKAEADRQFLQGVNQLVGHGWPYSPPSAGSPGWRFYAAAALSDKNPWWIVMPDVARALQRTSAMLRQGSPVVDVALYLPVDDAWADFSPGNVHLIEVLKKRIGPDVIPSILDAGFNFDLVDPESLAKATVEGDVSGGRRRRDTARWSLPNVERISGSVQRRLDAFARAGGIVVLRSRRTQAPSLARAVAARCDSSTSARWLPGDLSPSRSAIGAVHRRAGDIDFYFVANTSNLQRHSMKAGFRVSAGIRRMVGSGRAGERATFR